MRGQEITPFERQKIESFLRGKLSHRQIGSYLHRDHTVIDREVNRNKSSDGKYRWEEAQRKSEARKRKKRKRILETDEVLKSYVVKQIIEEQWSPKQISGIIKKHPESWMVGKGISHETIYQFIYEGQGRFMGLYQHLRRKHKRRQRQHARKHQQNQPISFITPISFRPNEIKEKQAFGHWESDTTLCEYRRAALSVQYERSIQLCRIKRIIDKTAEATEGIWRELIEELPVKSLTMDRGGENGNHWKLRLDHDIDTYHCDPYSSWQKGGVENLNGLIRQYLPRGTDLSLITDQQIYVIQEKLNNRPRAMLDFRSPNERLRELRTIGVVH